MNFLIEEIKIRVKTKENVEQIGKHFGSDYCTLTKIWMLLQNWASFHFEHFRQYSNDEVTLIYISVLPQPGV